MNVTKILNKLQEEDRFQGANSREGQEIIDFINKASFPEEKYHLYALCNSDTDCGFIPILLTKEQATVFGEEADLKTIVLYLKQLFPGKAQHQHIEDHAEQLIPFKDIKLPSELKKVIYKCFSDKQLEHITMKEKLRPRIEDTIQGYLQEYPKDTHLYLVMKVKSKSNVNVKLPVLCRISYEDAFKLSLFGDLSEFESIANVKAMSENNEIIKFVPELRQELNVFLTINFV